MKFFYSDEKNERFNPAMRARQITDTGMDVDYDAIFSQIKGYVKTVLKKERAGIGLAIGEFDPKVAAFWQVGGNYIVMNGALIRALEQRLNDREAIQNYVIVVLMHEYLHSLGYTDEIAARRLTHTILEAVLGGEHMATKISSRDLWEVFPQLYYAQPRYGAPLKIVDRFATRDASYIA
ncbi:hypothetical protein [Thermoplasma acidophilum]|uniref:Uncharacterized protein n=1 Tax=Thermoplasma acidophilum (strain ATCC 25905 / DSM 1728 / JCM 9062 / NBRC 15155 / AMRC-C165) TaxID=273075 RepID=Q9HK74_THEAC|nr:hypothetical protein [Thermoplasma acidophilum]CAC11865.1 hypothetical protein [Thermoplasma acidophilum]